MLSGAIICPDQKLAQELKQALADTHGIAIVRTIAHYLNGLDLVRFLRAAAPEVIFLSVQSRREALDTATATMMTVVLMEISTPIVPVVTTRIQREYCETLVTTSRSSAAGVPS